MIIHKKFHQSSKDYDDPYGYLWIDSGPDLNEALAAERRARVALEQKYEHQQLHYSEPAPLPP